MELTWELISQHPVLGDTYQLRLPEGRLVLVKGAAIGTTQMVFIERPTGTFRTPASTSK
jgi:hypothetical protein